MDDQSPTIRTTPVEREPDALPDQATHYVAPQPLPKISEHKTIDMVPVRLAPEVNPRHALTQRLTPVPARNKRRELMLGGAVAALLLAVLIGAGLRLLGRSSASAAIAPAASAPMVTISTTPAEPPLPAAAVLPEEPGAVAPAATPETKTERRTPASVVKSAAGPTPPVKPRAKGREVWLE